MKKAVHRPNRLTSGSLPRTLVFLAGPMAISALLQNVQSLIDLFWVGRLGREAVAALAMSGTILTLVFPLVMGMSAGSVAIVSRAIGAGHLDEASRVAGQSLTAAVLFGLLAGGGGWAASEPLVRMLGATGPVVDLSVQYLRVSFLGSFSAFVLFIGSAVLQAAGNAVIPMLSTLLANLVNFVLDPLLIYGLAGLPRLEVRGAALATVLSHLVACGGVAWVLVRGSHGLHAPPRTWGLTAAILHRLLRIGLPSSGQMLSRSLMNLVMMRQVAAFGTAAVAGYGIALRFHMIVLMPAFTLGNAVAPIVGQNLGAAQPDRARRAAWLATGIDLVIMVVSAVILTVWARSLVRFFEASPEVVQIGSEYLRIVSPWYAFAAFSIVLGRALQGAGDTLATLITTVIGLWGVQVPLAILLPRWFVPPIHGVWWAIALALLANGAMVTTWFQVGRWKHQRA